MPFFSSSSFDAVTIATAMNAAPADAAEAPAKDGSKEESADRTARTGGIFDAQRTKEVK